MVNAADTMDMDDHPPLRSEPLDQLIREDLDRLSVAELDTRIATLEGEIARTRRKLEGAVNHRASADELFQR